MILALLASAFAAPAACPLTGAISVVAERTEVTVTTPTGLATYSWPSLKAAAMACGYTETLRIIDERDKALLWGNAACGIGLCLLWPVGIAAPIYWVRASNLREDLNTTLIREAGQ